MISRITFFNLFIILLSACTNNYNNKYNSKLTIRNNIYYLTNITLDTSEFTTLRDSIQNTEAAFDLDYTWYVKIKFDSTYFVNLKNIVTKSENYYLINNEFDLKWNSIDTTKIKGIWYCDSTFFRFIQKPREFNPEPISLTIDTLTRILDLELIHL